MKLKYVERRVRSSGKVTWVVNPPRMMKDTIKATYEQFELLEEANEYAQALQIAYADHKRGVHREVRAAMASVDGLIEYYKSTTDYKNLSPNSKRLYIRMMQEASQTAIGASNVRLGAMKASNVTPDHADKLYQQLHAVKSAHRATHVCKVLRKIWFVGQRAGRVRNNPFQKMNIKGLDDRTVLWQPDDVEQFINTADELNKSSIGTLALLCYDLCQRPGDMRQLLWSDIHNNVVQFTQEKTGTEVQIPLSPRLIERLATIDRKSDHVVVCEATDKPYDRRLYAKWAAKVRNEAKLPSELQIRDLRRTGATEMAEAGCTEDELRSVTGHQSRDVLSIYVRPTARLAAGGMNKRFGAQQ